MVKNIPNGQKYPKWSKISQMVKNIPNAPKIFQMAINISTFFDLRSSKMNKNLDF
jgi:hypothetical protein